jgi:long-subunit acyl-CoA synthetase (AMP-forming)
MMVENDFDIIITSDKKISQPLVHNIAELLFHQLPHRDEDSKIILSHINEKYIEISLKKLRYILASLYKEFQEKNIKPGDSVLLTTLSVNNELYTILLLTGLLSYGVRVLFPMFVETKEVDTWIEQTQCTYVILPEKEIMLLSGHDREKQVIHEIRKIAENKHVTVYDVSKDFNLDALLDTTRNEYSLSDDPFVQQAIHHTFFSTDAVIFTTSGSSGKSKLVLYEQGGFLKNCQSWQTSGMYEKEKLGGRCFLDILPIP